MAFFPAGGLGLARLDQPRPEPLSSSGNPAPNRLVMRGRAVGKRRIAGMPAVLRATRGGEHAVGPNFACDPMEWAKQAFHDLNLLSVRPNAATAISMDMRDPLTSITRQVVTAQ